MREQLVGRCCRPSQRAVIRTRWECRTLLKPWKIGFPCRHENTALYIATAIAEIVGCYLRCWLRGRGSGWVLFTNSCLCRHHVYMAALPRRSVGQSMQPMGVYVAVALGWLVVGGRHHPSNWDLVGVAVTLAGMAIIAVPVPAAEV